MKQYICETCHKEFKSNKWDKNRTPKYCSRECYAKREITKEWLEKISKVKIWKIPWNKWIKMWEWKEHPKWTLWMKFVWRIVSEETRGKISNANRWKIFIERRWSNCHFWKWWITSENEAERKSVKYKEWRRRVFERDNYKCTICWINSKYLQADHIKPFSLFKDLRFDINNWRTLCIECHKKTETYWWKMQKYMMKSVS